MQIADVKGLDKKQLKLLDKIHERESMSRLTSQLIENPLIEFAAGIAFITWLTRGRQSWLERATGIDVAQGTLGAALAGVITAQQLSKSLPYLTDTAVKLSPNLGGLLK